MRWSSLLSAAALMAGFLSASANAAVIQSTYTHLNGVTWSAQFVVINDGDPAPINEFSVYFSESLFTNLAVGASPATWDSIVIQPDPNIPASGYLDALALDPADALTNGQSQAGFMVSFDYLGQGNPGQLGFDVFSDGLVLMSSGITTSPSAARLPEPNTLLLTAFGTLISMAATRRKLTIKE